MFVDKVKIYVKAGDGGNGVVAFRREKFVPRGGPNGGDGGNGGNIILKVDSNLSTLMDFRYNSHYKAERGEHGQGSNKRGKDADDLVIKIPPGTIVKDAERDIVIADLVEDEDTLVVARGGRGGKGNARFATAIHRAPDFAEKGEPGEELWITLELKLLADVGLVGLPNAGKSTLLSCMTRAKPKIANYPFTTLYPNLGVVDLSKEMGKSFVVADIPGLIEGAHEGQGLGHDFLRHIERTRLIVHVIDMSGFVQDPVKNFKTINAELEKYDEKLPEKPQIIVANKMDIPQSEDNLKRFKQIFKDQDLEILPVSAATSQGVKKLIYTISSKLEKLPKEYKTIKRKEKRYTVEDEKAYEIKKQEQIYYVSGKNIERLVAMTDLENESAVKRLQRIFKKSGLDDALKQKGIKQGDTVVIGKNEFTYIE